MGTYKEGILPKARIKKDLVIEAKTMATGHRELIPGLIFHSDRRSQYCSHKFQKELRRHGIVSSMSRKGNCWDNAVALSFFGSLKTARVFDSNIITREEGRRYLFDSIEMFYNCRQRHSFIDNSSPQEWEMKKTA